MDGNTEVKVVKVVHAPDNVRWELETLTTEFGVAWVLTSNQPGWWLAETFPKLMTERTLGWLRANLFERLEDEFVEFGGKVIDHEDYVTCAVGFIPISRHILERVLEG